MKEGGREGEGILGGMWPASDHVCWLDQTGQQGSADPQLQSDAPSTKGIQMDRKEQRKPGTKHLRKQIAREHLKQGRAHSLAAFNHAVQCLPFETWLDDTFCRLQEHEGRVGQMEEEYRETEGVSLYRDWKNFSAQSWFEKMNGSREERKQGEL